VRTFGLLASVAAAALLAGCSSSPAAVSSAAAPAATTASAAAAQPTAAASPSAAASATSAASAAAKAMWRPRAGLTWQWQLSGTIDASVDVQVYDIDGDTPASVVAKLHAAGRRVICYVNVGAWEDFRADKNAFPASVLGKSNGWPGERWLDIRRISDLKPIMAARFAACAAKGFDGIEADNVDGYVNDTGFDLTADDQLAYNRMFAALAHADGLAVGLKNDGDQVGQLLPSFDFSVDEQCFEYQECDQLKPFISADKPVFEVEYNLETSAFCAQATALGFSSMRKNLALDAPRWPCAVK
jgi:hypothetical protein